MAEERQVPGPVEENPQRLQSRPYESDWARLPAEEVHENVLPAGGPQGTMDSGPKNLPLMVIAVGLVVAFATFFVGNGWPLGIGLALIAVGAIWAGVRSPSIGMMHGTGPATFTEDDEGPQR